MTVKKITTYISGLFLCLITVCSCNDEAIELNDAFVRNRTYAEQASNTPLQLSTIRLDSVMTSGQNVAWVGKCRKPYIGNIHSVALCRLGEPYKEGAPNGYGWLQKNKEVYDSCTMVLRHTGAYEGDTMQYFHIRVRGLKTRLEFRAQDPNSNLPPESSFYNVRYFPEDSVIGEFVFRPRPTTRPRVRFRLNDDFGIAMRDFIIANNKFAADVASQKFDDFIKGIWLESCDDRVETKSLLAFRSDSIKIVLHSHIRGMEAIKVERVLSLTKGDRQYNRVWTEDTDPRVARIRNRYDQVIEDSLGFKSFTFEGLGYYTRINFPSIQNIKNNNRYNHVVKAVIKLYPEQFSYDKRRIPSSFHLFEVNKGNVLVQPVVNSRQQPVRAVLVYNPLDREQMYYEADLTYYFNMLLSAPDFDIYSGILMTWGEGMSPINYNYMTFNGHGVQRHRSALEVTYYNYDIENR